MLSAAQFPRWQGRIESMLERLLPPPDSTPARLHTAMRHAVLGGGKRLRPMLVYAAGALVHADAATLDHAAAAVELIHAYSLVHDDLPAMDDDALRRGRPTVHVAFDEATAILAGDALQTLAFAALSDAPAPAEVRLALLQTLTAASGSQGMCGGQALDLAATGQRQTLTDLEAMHRAKTGALIRASVRMGAQAGNADATMLASLDDYATALGLAFQIRDDLLDIEGDAAQLGKTAGKDVAQDKSTFPALLGIEASYARLDDLTTHMCDALANIPGDTLPLQQLGEFAARRRH
ncbi:MAG: polyprenyl synthetase family protein [Xanthomonadaceae bacterium]|nr:polyprenyl synthetase family protein [Xanthomonadaceae bacterium]